LVEPPKQSGVRMSHSEMLTGVGTLGMDSI
jgi:hypothetical protein